MTPSSTRATAHAEDPEQWVMIITGTGDKAFCSGMYVTEILSGYG